MHCDVNSTVSPASGDPALQGAVEEALEGATSVLHGLEFGPLPQNSRARLHAELELHSQPVSPPTSPTSTSTSALSTTTSASSSSILDEIFFPSCPPTSPPCKSAPLSSSCSVSVSLFFLLC